MRRQSVNVIWLAIPRPALQAPAEVWPCQFHCTASTAEALEPLPLGSRRNSSR